MFHPLAIFRGNGGAKRQQRLKERILRNREGVLDAFSENIKGAKACPFLIGQKCIGGLCEHFQKYSFTNDTTKKTTEYYRCAFNQTPQLLIEIIDNVRIGNDLLRELLAKQA